MVKGGLESSIKKWRPDNMVALMDAPKLEDFGTQRMPSSITLPTQQTRQPDQQKHAHGLMATLKKPFQGWSKDLLRARDDDDDDYNFASGMRRGAHLYYEPEKDA
ncbi:hypothetical protein C7974DRAFT_408298 [Boeremia exigua]|uniref:uncharacterized protein n=1 Tax=Boeremia exigua TaxID=749465 RepID=UPI001E8CFD80|nr:uncharacterized protein C7974DRAFT_408298 [Boeremia exigua]KAH6644630.1 hypothetical protein C7974DRAFT_408298 [Boeremia exigua]